MFTWRQIVDEAVGLLEQSGVEPYDPVAIKGARRLQNAAHVLFKVRYGGQVESGEV